MNTQEYLSSIPYETHFVNHVVSHGWVAGHLRELGFEGLSVCPECGVSDFEHLANCSVAAGMEPHRAGLEREGRYVPPAPQA